MSAGKLCRCCLKMRSAWFKRFHIHMNSARFTTHWVCVRRLQGLGYKVNNLGSVTGMIVQPYSNNTTNGEFSEGKFDQLCTDTLDRLAESLEDLSDKANVHPEFDVAVSDGVLTLKLGGSNGTYVINKQTPNRQIWLSSPISGPKRYDFIEDEWIYKRDGKTIQRLLSEELTQLLQTEVQLTSDS